MGVGVGVMVGVGVIEGVAEGLGVLVTQSPSGAGALQAQEVSASRGSNKRNVNRERNITFSLVL